MSSKKYADSDFFLALMKDSDWLKDKAKATYEKHKGDIYVTPFTVLELMIVCIREGIPVREMLQQISRISMIAFIKWELFFKACDYIDQGATVFDALLMAFAKENEIISSDNIYEKFGFKVIDLKR